MSLSTSAAATETSTTRLQPKALTVGDVVAQIRDSIEQRFPAAIWVEGELSNYFLHAASGHMYFSLVDERARDRRGQPLILPCAFFRHANQDLKFRLEDGLKVLCLGELTTYAARGQYQLRVVRVEPKGLGALQLAFEQLQKRLAAEGLFDEARKRPIPRLPERVGLITSRSGSVVHDMVVRLRGRFHVRILPVKVQGEGAAEEIVQAIQLANAQRLADVLIVGRGGGSLEDLWAFNEERVARAIFASRIPVVSAVGHEDHWTISDYVADVRASTPTHAAELLTHDQQRLIEETHDLIQRLVEGMQTHLENASMELDGLSERLRLLHPVHQLKEYTRRIVQAQVHLMQSMRHVLEREDHQLQGLAGRLSALSPLAVLGRGYSIAFRLPARSVVTDARSVRVGDELETLLAHGRLTSTVHRTVVNDSREFNGADA